MKAKKDEPRARVRIDSRIKKAASQHHSHYAIAHVQVTPNADKKAESVFVVATDGHVATVQESQGETDGVHLIPNNIIPKKNGTVILRDHWAAPVGNRLAQEPEGRFPECGDDAIFPEITDEHIAIPVNAELLHRLAKSMTDDGSVTLFVRGSHPTRPMIVVPATPYALGAIGAIMPVESDDSKRARYGDLRKKFFAARAAATAKKTTKK